MGRKTNGDGIKGILGWHQPNSGNNLIEADILECTKKLYTLIFFIRLKVLSCVSIYGTFYFPKRFYANKMCFLEENTVLISGICQIMGTVNHLHFSPLISVSGSWGTNSNPYLYPIFAVIAATSASRISSFATSIRLYSESAASIILSVSKQMFLSVSFR